MIFETAKIWLCKAKNRGCAPVCAPVRADRYLRVSAGFDASALLISDASTATPPSDSRHCIHSPMKSRRPPVRGGAVETRPTRESRWLRGARRLSVHRRTARLCTDGRVWTSKRVRAPADRCYVAIAISQARAGPRTKAVAPRRSPEIWHCIGRSDIRSSNVCLHL